MRSTTMEAVWFENGHVEHRSDVPAPNPPPGWALIRVRVAGLCGTDRQLLRGYADFTGIPGHEFVGDVVEGSATWLGKRVVANINVGCGVCAECALSGHHCHDRRVLGIRELAGAFAEYVALPEANLVEVPAEIDDAAAALAEPLAAALHVIDVLPADARDAVVLGDGALGQLTAQALSKHGLDTTLVGRHDRKLARLEKLGVRTTKDPSSVRRPPVVVDCTGRPEGLEAALAMVQPRGTVVLKSTHGEPVPVDLSRLVVHECRLVGSRCGDVEAAVQALATELIEVDELVDATCSRAELPAVLGTAQPKPIKVQVL